MGSDFDIDGDLVRKLAGLLEETGLTEIEFSSGERAIRVTKAAQAAAAPAPAPAAAPAAAPAPSPADSGAPPAGAVTSPMVGTAYLGPDPGSPPFARPGDQVAEGQTVMIVEAMKVMNPIRAPKAGTVRQVLVKDAQPVEYGEILMIID
ncbi:MAG: acetyl-CoA carboxylase biotin carboxyl carrier protein [Azospirillaceae bacterium]